MDLELEFHVATVTEELITQGWNPSEAAAEAQRRFGNVDGIARQCVAIDRHRQKRKERRMALDTLGHDLRRAIRTLTRRKAYTVSVVATLALALGAVTAILHLLSVSLIRPLPFEQPQELIAVWQTDRATGTVRENASLPDILDFNARSRSLTAVEGVGLFEVNLIASQTASAGEQPVAHRATLALVTPGLAGLLGVRPIQGRDLKPADGSPGSEPVALISESTRERQFGGKDNVLGERIVLDDESYTVVGVVPDLEFPNSDVWLPVRGGEELYPRYRHWIAAFGRLAPGTTIEAAQTELADIATQLENEYPRANTNRGVFLEPLETVLRGDMKTPLWLLLLAVLAVFLMTCTSVANGVLAQNAERRQELAIASALGASRTRLLQRFFFESLLYVGLGLLAGLGVAALLLASLRPLLPTTVLLSLEHSGFSIAPMAVGFATLLALTAAFFFTAIPAVQIRALRGDTSPNSARGTGAQGRLVLRRLLVASQVGISVVLLFGTGLMVRSLLNLSSVNTGFLTENILRIDFRLPETRYPRSFENYPNWTEVTTFNRTLRARVDQLPGVVLSTITTDHPLSAGFTNSFQVVGRPRESDQGEVKIRLVSASYTETNGVPLLEGRYLSERDTATSEPVLLINQAMAEQVFPDQNPLDQKIAFWGSERRIVGILGNERIDGLDQPAPAAMYGSIDQAPQRGQATLMVRTEGIDPAALVPSITEIVRGMDPAIALFNAKTMEETLAGSQQSRRFLSLLLALFSAASLAIACLGVQTVLAFLVANRRCEIGVRMALGARRVQILGAVMREGLSMTLLGVVLGVAGSLLSARALDASLGRMLFEVSLWNPKLYVLVTLALVFAACAACLHPALRATRVEPTEALRTE